MQSPVLGLESRHAWGGCSELVLKRHCQAQWFDVSLGLGALERACFIVPQVAADAFLLAHPQFLLGALESASGVGGPTLFCESRGRVVVESQEVLSRGEKMVRRVKGLYAMGQ